MQEDNVEKYIREALPCCLFERVQLRYVYLEKATFASSKRQCNLKEREQAAFEGTLARASVR